MNIYDIIKKRRSVRSYKPETVEEEKLNRILEAARRLGQMETAIFIFLGGANPEVVNLLVAAKSLKC